MAAPAYLLQVASPGLLKGPRPIVDTDLIGARSETVVVRFNDSEVSIEYDTDEAAMAHRLADILPKLAAYFQTASEAIEWMNSTQLPGYSGQTAMTLLKKGRGHRVLDYIDAFREGLHA